VDVDSLLEEILVDTDDDDEQLRILLAWGAKAVDATGTRWLDGCAGQPAQPHDLASCSMTVGGRLQGVRTPSPNELREWRQEFDAAARRPLKTRFRYAFVHTYKPVLDDARYRSFETMAEYRAWCERELPRWLGYGQDL